MPDDALSLVMVGPAVLAEMARTAGSTPFEVCGVWAGHRSGSVGMVAASAAVPNVHPEGRTAYAMDPLVQARVWLEAEAQGFEVLGVWHSHPSGLAEPSSTDVEYMQPWLVYPIITRKGLMVYRRTEDGWCTVDYELRGLRARA